jgi:hypothetical protein
MRKSSAATSGAVDETDAICGNLWTLTHNCPLSPHYAPSPVSIGVEGLLLHNELNLRFHISQQLSEGLATRPVSLYECLEGFQWTIVANMCPHLVNTPLVVNSAQAETKVANFMGRPDQESQVVFWALSDHTTQQLFQINPSNCGLSDVAFVIQNGACLSCILKRKPEYLARQRKSKLGVIMSSSTLEAKAILL